MSADVPSRARSFLGRHQMDASMAGVSRANRLPAESAIVERALLWAFIAGLAWCPFWFGSNVLLAWGINAVLFPGLVAIYELSLLIRGERHPVAIRQIKVPAALFAAVVLWILFQNATWTPDWLHHPIWQMSADALDRPVDWKHQCQSRSDELGPPETYHGCKRLLDCHSTVPRRLAGEFLPLVRLPQSVAPTLLTVFSLLG